MERQRLKRKKKKVKKKKNFIFSHFLVGLFVSQIMKKCSKYFRGTKNKVSRLTSVIFGKFNQRDIRYKLHIESFLQLEKLTQYCSI